MALRRKFAWQCGGETSRQAAPSQCDDPESSECGPSSTGVGPNSGNCGPGSTKYGAELVNIGPKFLGVDHDRLGIGQIWPEFVELLPGVGQVWLAFDNCWPNMGHMSMSNSEPLVPLFGRNLEQTLLWVSGRRFGLWDPPQARHAILAGPMFVQIHVRRPISQRHPP